MAEHFTVTFDGTDQNLLEACAPTPHGDDPLALLALTPHKDNEDPWFLGGTNLEDNAMDEDVHGVEHPAPVDGVKPQPVWIDGPPTRLSEWAVHGATGEKLHVLTRKSTLPPRSDD